MDILRKANPWMIVSLLSATSAFAQNKNTDKCCTDTTPPMPVPMTAAYNAPARVDLCGGWDFYGEASFIYWQPTQDNMEFGIASSSTAASSANIFGTVGTPVSNHMLNLDQKYHPGFEVGLGMGFDYDNWDSYLQYTWFHNTTSSSSTAPSGDSIFPSLLQPGATGAAGSFDSASATWHLKMDLADWQLARSYYVGTKLTFRPYAGVRAAWIRQKYGATYVRTSTSASTVEISQKSTSWGVGPEVGLNASYLLGCGVRMFGDVEADVIYTRYNANLNEQNTTGTQLISLKQNGLSTVRPHANLDLGFGWGSYFRRNTWHVDLAASYGFQIFWNQNMFRHFTDSVATYNSNMPNGDLYIQGLNVTARLDF